MPQQLTNFLILINFLLDLYWYTMRNLISVSKAQSRFKLLFAGSECSLTHPDNDPFWHIGTNQIFLVFCMSIHSNNKQEISAIINIVSSTSRHIVIDVFFLHNLFISCCIKAYILFQLLLLFFVSSKIPLFKLLTYILWHNYTK